VPNRIGSLMRLCHPNIHPNGWALTRLGENRWLPVQVDRGRSDTARVEDPMPRIPLAGPAPAASHWWIECADPFGRARAMNVVVQHGQVVVVAPPGESAVLSAHQTRLLGRALGHAAASTRG
jgi:hypothetical protein